MIKRAANTIRASSKVVFNKHPAILTYRTFSSQGWQSHQFVIKFEGNHWEPGAIIVLTHDEIRHDRHYDWVAEELVEEFTRAWPGVSSQSAKELLVELKKLTPEMDSGVN